MAALLETLTLQTAGFPFDADDFEMGYWLDLGMLAGRIKAKRMF